MPSQANVDERIVEMQIDNKKFESGAQKTIKILDKLDKALDIQPSTKGFDAMNNSVNKLQISLNGLEVAGMRVIQRLTDSAYNFVTKTVKSLTIDQVSAGFDKYQKMIESTQSIIAATRDKVGVEGGFADEIDQMNQVQAALEKILWYTDETSYNFTDMADNLGKFLATGTDLDQSVTAILGVASWGAASGATSQKVSNAMYNISQALGAGKMMAIDWKSIENAGMATLDFKKNALKTAAAMGQLNEVMKGDDETTRAFTRITDTQRFDDLGNVINMTEKEVDDLITALNLRESLSEGWFTSDVFMKVLENYGSFADKLHETTESTGVETRNLLDILDEYRKAERNPGKYKGIDWEAIAEDVGGDADAIKAAIEELDAIGIEYSETGFRLGQESKTWADVIGYTKEAISSGWMKTFDYIVGDYYEAKKLWTDVADEVYEFFIAGGDIRNDILDAWSMIDEETGLNGRDFLFARTEDFQGAFWDLIDAIHSFVDPISDAFAEVFGFGDNDAIEETGSKLREFTKRFKEFTAELGFSDEAKEGLKNLFTVIFSIAKLGGTTFAKVLEIFIGLLAVIGDIADAILSIFSGEFDPIAFFDKLRESIKKLLPSFSDIKNGFKNLGSVLIRLIPTEQDFIDFFSAVKEFGKQAWKSIKEFFTIDHLKSMIPTMDEVNAALDRIGSFLEERYPTLFKWFTTLRESGIVEKVLNGITNGLTNIGNFFSGLNIDTSGFMDVLNRLSEIIGAIFTGLFGNPEELKAKVIAFLTAVWNGISEFASKLTFRDILRGVKTAGFTAVMVEIASAIAQFKNIEKEVKALPKSISETFGKLGNAFDKLGTSFLTNAFLKIAIGIGIIVAALYAMSKIDEERLTHAASIIIVILAIISLIAKNLTKNATFANNNINIKRYKVFGDLAGLLIGIAAVILSIGIALSKLSGAKNLGASVGILIGLLLLITLIVAGISWSVNALEENEFGSVGKLLFKAGLAFVAIAVAIRLIAKPIQQIASIQIAGTAWRAFGIIAILVVIMGGILIALAAIINGSHNAEQIDSIGNTILKFAAAMAIIAVAIRLLILPIITLATSMSAAADQTKAAFWMVLGFVGVFALLIIILGKLSTYMTTDELKQLGNTMLKAAATMVIMAIAIRMLVTPIILIATTLATLGNITWVAAGMLAAFLVVLMGISVLLSLIKPEASKSALIMAIAIVALALAINLLLPALIAIIGLISGVIAFAASMDNLAGILASFFAFAIILAVVGVGMLLIGSAVALFGAGVFLAGTGVFILAAGLGLLAAVLAPLGIALENFSKSFKTVSDNLKNLEYGKIALIGGILLVLVVVIYLLIRSLIKFSSTMKKTEKDGDSFGKKILNKIAGLFSKLGSKIKDSLPIILKALGALLVLAAAYLVGLIPDLANLLGLGILALLESITLFIHKNKQNIIASVVNLVVEIAEVIVNTITWVLMTAMKIGDALFGSMIDRADARRIALVKAAKEVSDYQLKNPNTSEEELEAIRSAAEEKYYREEMEKKIKKRIEEETNDDSFTEDYNLATRLTNEAMDKVKIKPDHEIELVSEDELSTTNALNKIKGQTTDDIQTLLGSLGDTLSTGVDSLKDNLTSGLTEGTDEALSSTAETIENNTDVPEAAGVLGTKTSEEFVDNVDISDLSGSLNDAFDTSNIIDGDGVMDQMLNVVAGAQDVCDENPLSLNVIPVVDMDNLNDITNYGNGTKTKTTTPVSNASYKASNIDKRAGTVENNTTNHNEVTQYINMSITTQPGQDNAAIAREVVKLINTDSLRREAASG